MQTGLVVSVVTTEPVVLFGCMSRLSYKLSVRAILSRIIVRLIRKCKPEDFNYKNDAKHASMFIATRLWDEDTLLFERLKSQFTGHSNCTHQMALMENTHSVFSRRIAFTYSSRGFSSPARPQISGGAPGRCIKVPRTGLRNIPSLSNKIVTRTF